MGNRASGIPPCKEYRERLMLRNVMANSLLVGLSLAFLWHFSNIWRYGQYLAQEPNIIIRSLETAMLLVIYAFGISRLVADFKRDGKDIRGVNGKQESR